MTGQILTSQLAVETSWGCQVHELATGDDSTIAKDALSGGPPLT